MAHFSFEWAGGHVWLPFVPLFRPQLCFRARTTAIPTNASLIAKKLGKKATLSHQAFFGYAFHYLLIENEFFC